MNSQRKEKSEWDEVSSWWHAEAGDQGIYHQYADIDPVVIKLLGSTKSKNILEIGCGNGYFSRFLAKHGAKVTGLDMSSKMVALAQEEEKKHSLGITYFVRDAADLYGIKSKSFDSAISNMALMDVKNIEKAIKEIARVLKPDATFVFSILHPAFMFDGTWERIDGKNRFGRIMWRYLTPYVDKKYWGSEQFTTTGYARPLEFYMHALRAAGFAIVDLREVSTKKPLRKMPPGEDTLRKASRYSSLAEKKEKLRSQREIPYFLVAEARKIG